MPAQRFLWYDLETWGRDSRQRAICQFAAQLTDLDCQSIGEPINISCVLPPDLLPEPEAALVHRRPLPSLDQGALCERDFCQKVHEALSAPEQCIVGYNNIRFDDGFIRHLFFRNYYPPYSYSYENGNSRWDLIDFVRACAALRPENLNWPLLADGRISFKLEALALANGIEIDAHDAVSDVRATIGLAAKIARQNPKLFDNLRARMQSVKQQAEHLLSQDLLLHVSGQFSARSAHCSLLQPLYYDDRKNLHALDMRSDSRALLDLEPEQLRERLFTKHKQLYARGLQPLAVKQIHLNKAPLVLSSELSVRLLADRPEIESRMRLTWQQAQRNRLNASERTALIAKLKGLYSEGRAANTSAELPPHSQLYQGFTPRSDSDRLQQFRDLLPAAIMDYSFTDQRLQAMRLGYKARNFPESLSPDEQQEFFSTIDTEEIQRFQQQTTTLLAQKPDSRLTELQAYYQSLNEQIAAHSPR